jgi:acetyl esterase/lipase
MPLTSSFGLDPTIEQRFREIGAKFDGAVLEESRKLFEGRKDASLPPDSRRVDDVAYGTHDRQMLDLCIPSGDSKPIVVFVPGGGMVGGDKGFYAHIPAFFARQGYLGVCMNYRLAPEFLFPSGAQDVAAVVDWLADNASSYGADASRIFIVAQSAGAVHAASTLFDKRTRPRHYANIRAAVLMSGVYEITPDHEGGNINLYFGNEAAELKDRSSSNHVQDSSVPVILTVAELEPAFFGLSTAALIDALTRRDKRAPEVAWLKGHNHLSAVLGFGGPGDQLGMAIVDVLKRYDA